MCMQRAVLIKCRAGPEKSRALLEIWEAPWAYWAKTAGAEQRAERGCAAVLEFHSLTSFL